jgi:hypothetical protein
MCSFAQLQRKINNYYSILVSFFFFFFTTLTIEITFATNPNIQEYSRKEYQNLKDEVAAGWNTWNTKSVLSHVLLPQCFALNLQLHNAQSGKTLENALIGRQGDISQIEKITQGDRTYDGSYTDLTIEWEGIKVRIQSAAKENSLNLLITPITANNFSFIKVKPEILWGNNGVVKISENGISAKIATKELDVKTVGQIASANDSCFIFSLKGKIGITAGSKATIETIEREIEEARKKCEYDKKKHEAYIDLYEPMQNVLAWNTIYEPTEDRVITLVSQVWSEVWNGFIFPVWDTYLAAYMLSFDNKALAYSNALAVTNNLTSAGFVPNVATGYGKTEDRSQPPIGSFVIKELYKRYHEKWILHETFDKLLSWNRWWDQNRNYNGFLCWGSTPYPNYQNNNALAYGVNELQGALYESGLDNSSMYDNIPFDKEKHVMLLADVGLMSFYVLDCNSLAEIAEVINKPEIAQELRERAEMYAVNLQKLWNEEKGIFLNKHLDTDSPSHHLSPTLFYPLLAGVATQVQAERMINEHFYNPEEFWGEYIMPSTARNEAAFNDNHYFRGRIWGPMNFLVYMGLRKYNIGQSREDMVAKSKTLLLKTWDLKRDVYENYNATTGEGFDMGSSQKSYYWGALLGFMSFIENGLLEAPENAINTKIINNQ